MLGSLVDYDKFDWVHSSLFLAFSRTLTPIDVLEKSLLIGIILRILGWIKVQDWALFIRLSLMAMGRRSVYSFIIL